MTEEKPPLPKTLEEQPNFGKILLATLIGILLLGGITYAAYRFSQRKAPSGTCDTCVGGTYIRYDDWDQNSDGVINNCNEACLAHFGPNCNGNAYCSNPGSTDPGVCCTCETAAGDSCITLPSPTGITSFTPPPIASSSPTFVTSPSKKPFLSPTAEETPANF